jgi:hypothetical protein
MWEMIRNLSPTAKNDPSDLVRASAMLLVTTMTNEWLTREELRPMKREERLRQAQLRYVHRFQTDLLTIDWGLALMLMAGTAAEDIPPTHLGCI